MPENHTAIFCASALAILPLAAMIGRATDVLADRLGGGIGGLLNATFGNAAELIIGALALREGLFDLVKASLTGSIIGNVLLVFGASAFVGGLKHHDPALQPHRGRAWARPCCCSAPSAWSSPPCFTCWRTAAAAASS